METIHILNPAAGRGLLPDPSSLDGEVHKTSAPGEVVSFLRRRLRDGGEYRIFAHGGDGTQNEVVTGIMQAGAGSRVVLSPVPTGSGNDFARVTDSLGGETVADVIKYNDRYAINEINTGFDTGVVVRTNSIKRLPLIKGTAAYILGVVGELIGKRAAEMTLTVRYADGGEETFSGKYLLCVLANGPYYGGGFMAAPRASVSDGALDFLLASDMGRSRFLGLVGKYRAGKHLAANGEVIPEAADILVYRRCVSLRLDGVPLLPAHG